MITNLLQQCVQDVSVRLYWFTGGSVEQKEGEGVVRCYGSLDMMVY